MGYSIASSVWERRTGYETMGERTFVAAVTLFTTYGLLVSSVVAWLCLPWKFTFGSFVLVGLVVPLAGIFIARSGQPVFSFIGYNLIAIGLGAILGPAVTHIKAPTLISVLQVTLGVTMIASVVGIIYPKSLESWAIYLFTGLLALIFVRLAQIVMVSLGYSSSGGYVPLIEYGASVLFTLYIVYDWNRAMRVPHTFDNSIDCAIAIYLDILNLFITILNIKDGND